MKNVPKLLKCATTVIESAGGKHDLKALPGEICMAIFRCSQYFVPQINSPQLSNIIHHNNIRIQVNHPLNLNRDNISQINPRVIQRLVQSLANRFRYLAPNPVRIKPVHPETEVRKRRLDAGMYLGFQPGTEEMEHDVFGTRGVLQDG